MAGEDNECPAVRMDLSKAYQSLPLTGENNVYERICPAFSSADCMGRIPLPDDVCSMAYRCQEAECTGGMK
jgi:hypothetical protein